MITRHGYLLAEWNRGLASEATVSLRSASKSAHSSLLGIVDEGKLPGIDARVVDYYPETTGVADGEGTKPGRYAFPENAGITFRRLIGDTSGYLKRKSDRA